MKKGVVGLETALVGIVLTASTILVLAVMFKIFFASAEGEFTEKQCQTSLQLTRQLDDTLSISCVQPVPNLGVKCTREFMTVADERVFHDGDDVTHQYDAACPTSQGDQCLPENVVADEMARCWQLFFNGEMTVFQQVEENSAKILTRKDGARSCFICSEITLSDEGVEDLTAYLKAKKYTDDKTYYQFIAQNPAAFCDDAMVHEDGLGYPTCWEGVADGGEQLQNLRRWPSLYQESGGPKLSEDENAKLTYPAGGTYAVTFIRRGLGTCEGDGKSGLDKLFLDWTEDNNLLTLFPPIRGIADSVGEMAAEEYLTNTVQLIPSDRVNAYCDVVIV